jgi:hypothetical protein
LVGGKMKSCKGCRYQFSDLCTVYTTYRTEFNKYTNEEFTYVMLVDKKINDMRTTGECGPEAKLFEPTLLHRLYLKIGNVFFWKLRA